MPRRRKRIEISDKVLLKMVGILCITALELHALNMGIDGQLFGLVIATIGGIVGYTIALNKNNKDNNN